MNKSESVQTKDEKGSSHHIVNQKRRYFFEDGRIEPKYREYKQDRSHAENLCELPQRPI